MVSHIIPSYMTDLNPLFYPNHSKLVKAESPELRRCLAKDIDLGKSGNQSGKAVKNNVKKPFQVNIFIKAYLPKWKVCPIEI
jgi:hypothetical protein